MMFPLQEGLTETENFIVKLERRIENSDRSNPYTDVRMSTYEYVLTDIRSIKEWIEIASERYGLDHITGVEDASKILGLSPGTVKNKCANGEIVAKKIGKTWVIDKNQLNNKEELAWK